MFKGVRKDNVKIHRIPNTKEARANAILAMCSLKSKGEGVASKNLPGGKEMSDEEVIATLECMTLHDDFYTQESARATDHVFLFEGRAPLEVSACKTLLRGPDPKCIQRRTKLCKSMEAQGMERPIPLKVCGGQV